MIELAQDDFFLVIPLLSGIGQRVLPHAVCEGINPGRVFVDQRDDPKLALIWTPVGYYFLCGDPTSCFEDNLFSDTITRIFIPASLETGENCLILITSSQTWKEHLSTLLPGREIIQIYRRPFEFDIKAFHSTGNWRAQIPESMHLVSMDAKLAEKTGVLASWATLDDFLAYGLGFALVKDEEIICTCTSVFANQKMLEIDVHTVEEHQRKGYATLTASALIEECVRRGKEPNWECFWDNELSASLANHLGFFALPDYPVFFWEETR